MTHQQKDTVIYIFSSHCRGDTLDLHKICGDTVAIRNCMLEKTAKNVRLIT